MKRPHLNFFAWTLLLVVICAALHGVHENVHAMQSHVTPCAHGADPAGSGGSEPCPSPDHGQDGCDTCAGCACHASIIIRSCRLAYDPFVSRLEHADPFRFIPEVYLRRFIPPQNLA